MTHFCKNIYFPLDFYGKVRKDVLNTFQMILWEKNYETQFNYCFFDFALYCLSITRTENFIAKTILRLLKTH